LATIDPVVSEKTIKQMMMMIIPHMTLWVKWT